MQEPVGVERDDWRGDEALVAYALVDWVSDGGGCPLPRSGQRGGRDRSPKTKPVWAPCWSSKPGVSGCMVRVTEEGLELIIMLFHICSNHGCIFRKITHEEPTTHAEQRRPA